MCRILGLDPRDSEVEKVSQQQASQAKTIINCLINHASSFDSIYSIHFPARHGAVIKLSQAAKIAQNKGINNWYVANAP